jgi:isocitrate dehydrogenase kinase/phosphatase
MNEPIYPYKKSNDVLIFDFESIGRNGISNKKIVYSTIEDLPDIFNLSLFEVLDDGTLDIYFESKNQDLPQIMATVMSTMNDFFCQYPNKKIAFTGSTINRTRLYRIVINKLSQQSESVFYIEGITENGIFERFRSNQNYIAYVISLTN